VGEGTPGGKAARGVIDKLFDKVTGGNRVLTILGEKGKDERS